MTEKKPVHIPAYYAELKWHPSFISGEIENYAEQLCLVVELNNVPGIHGYFLIQGSDRTQYYDVRGAHVNTHYQIYPRVQLNRLNSKWEEEGYCKWDGGGNIPLKFYAFLANDQDHHLPYLTVINSVEDNPDLQEIQETVPFEELGKLMLEDIITEKTKKKRRRKKKDRRQNERNDIGFTGMNSTDNNTIPGIYIPGRHQEAKQWDGCPGDHNREVSVFKSACKVSMCADWIQRGISGLDESMTGTLFSDKHRASIFSQRWLKDIEDMSEIPDALRSAARFEGASVFLSGELPGGVLKKTEEHVDRGNGVCKGYDHCPTLIKIVSITTSDGSVWRVRVGCNIYGKRACESAIDRSQKLQRLVEFLEESEDKFKKEVSMPAPKDRFVPPRGVTESTWAYRADKDKSLYYSLYGNELLRIAERTDWNRAVVIEALFTIHLTPCPMTWLTTIRETMEKLSRFQSSGMTDHLNLVELFIRTKLERDKSLGCGRYNRCQPSARAMIHEDLYSSLQNLDEVLEDMCDDCNKRETEQFVGRMQKEPELGGCCGLGAFHAQSAIHIATMCGFVTQTDHVENVTISKSTKTAKRITERFEIEDKHMKEVVPFVADHMSITRYVAENLVCECLRRENLNKDGKKRPVIKHDVFADGHRLLRIETDGVFKYDLNGGKKRVEFGGYSHQSTWYQPKVKWWDGDQGDSSILIDLSREDILEWWKYDEQPGSVPKTSITRK